MKTRLKRTLGTALLVGAVLTLGGCVAQDPPPAGGPPSREPPPNIDQAAPLTGMGTAG